MPFELYICDCSNTLTHRSFSGFLFFGGASVHSSIIPTHQCLGKVLISLHCYHSNLLCHSPLSARTLLLSEDQALHKMIPVGDLIRCHISSYVWHIRWPAKETWRRTLQRFRDFNWSPSYTPPSRCSFDSSHLPWSYWTVWSTATVRRRRTAGGETKEVTRRLKPSSITAASLLRVRKEFVCVRRGNYPKQGCSHTVKKSSSLLLVAPVLCALNAGGKLLGFVVVVFLLKNEIKSEFCFQRT